MDEMESSKQNWFATLPGLITSIATLLVAVGGIIALLKDCNCGKHGNIDYVAIDTCLTDRKPDGTFNENDFDRPYTLLKIDKSDLKQGVKYKLMIDAHIQLPASPETGNLGYNIIFSNGGKNDTLETGQCQARGEFSYSNDTLIKINPGKPDLKLMISGWYTEGTHKAIKFELKQGSVMKVMKTG